MTPEQSSIAARLEAAGPAWVSQRELRDACLPGRSVRTVNYHLFKLRRAGLPVQNNQAGGYRLGGPWFSPRGLTNRTARRVLEHVSARTGVPVDSILGKRVFAEMVSARRRAARILRRLGYSLPEIGCALNRHHTTVLAYVGAAA